MKHSRRNPRVPRACTRKIVEAANVGTASKDMLTNSKTTTV